MRHGRQHRSTALRPHGGPALRLSLPAALGMAVQASSALWTPSSWGREWARPESPRLHDLPPPDDHHGGGPGRGCRRRLGHLQEPRGGQAETGGKDGGDRLLRHLGRGPASLRSVDSPGSLPPQAHRNQRGHPSPGGGVRRCALPRSPLLRFFHHRQQLRPGGGERLLRHDDHDHFRRDQYPPRPPVHSGVRVGGAGSRLGHGHLQGATALWLGWYYLAGRSLVAFR